MQVMTVGRRAKVQLADESGQYQSQTKHDKDDDEAAEKDPRKVPVDIEAPGRHWANVFAGESQRKAPTTWIRHFSLEVTQDS